MAWVDMSMFLEEQTFEAEQKLWEELCAVKILITPGGACFSDKPGFYRVCFAYPDVGDCDSDDYECYTAAIKELTKRLQSKFNGVDRVFG